MLTSEQPIYSFVESDAYVMKDLQGPLGVHGSVSTTITFSTKGMRILDLTVLFYFR